MHYRNESIVDTEGESNYDFAKSKYSGGMQLINLFLLLYHTTHEDWVASFSQVLYQVHCHERMSTRMLATLVFQINT